MPASTASSSNDRATVIAVGALAATLAALCHETLGHGLGCVGAGGQIRLLTSIWFRCQGAFPTADAGGPIGNLVAGFSALALLSRVTASPTMRLLLLMFGTLNLFWLLGQLAFESVAGAHNDWYYVSWQMGWPSSWRLVGAIVGISGYVLVGRWTEAIVRKQGGPPAYAIRLAYVASAASAVIAGLMWRPEPFRSALEGFVTLGIAPLGLLGVARGASRNLRRGTDAGSVPRSWVWISMATVLFGIFLFVQAQGLGPLAASGFSPQGAN